MELHEITGVLLPMRIIKVQFVPPTHDRYEVIIRHKNKNDVCGFAVGVQKPNIMYSLIL